MSSHDREFRRNRLRGLALQIERGQVDGEFAECDAPISPLSRALMVKRIRELADTIAAGREP